MGNPNYRNFGIRDAKFQKASGAIANTFTDTGDLVTAAAHGLSNGDQVVFQTIVTTTGASVNVRYYVIGATTNTFQVSTTYGGSAVALTTDGSGTYKSILEYDIYLANKIAIAAKTSSFTYKGDDTELDRQNTLGYTITIDADCVPLATHQALFSLSAYTASLPAGFTSLVYGGSVSERAGVTAGFWAEGTATRVDATTSAETDVIVRRWFPLGTVTAVGPGEMNTGDKTGVEQYIFAASKTAVDVAAGALPATIPTGNAFYLSLEKSA